MGLLLSGGSLDRLSVIWVAIVAVLFVVAVVIVTMSAAAGDSNILL